MDCKKAQLLMISVWVGDPGVTDQERESFKSHVIACPVCAWEYKETKEIMSLVRRHWGPMNKENRHLLQKRGYPIPVQGENSASSNRSMTVEEGWRDLLRRCPDLTQCEKRSKWLQLFGRVSAVTACMVVGLLTWLAFSIYSKIEIAQGPVQEQVASAQKPSIKVELVSDNIRIPIPTGCEITTSKKLKTVIINEKHRMVMNFDTVLMVEPLIENTYFGCLVKLAAGEIFAHVKLENDNNPFVVETVHGKAVIKGTLFDMKAMSNSTTLVVTEGIVQFVSERGTVDVAAEQMSEIVALTAPTKPIACDNLELTAWATSYEFVNSLAQAKPAAVTGDIISELPHPYP
jgi:hypothetical protein